MKLQRLFGLALVALIPLAGCKKDAPNAKAPPGEPTHAQPELTTIQLWLGPEQLKAEVAITPNQIRTGMMFRTNVDENEGMIFVLSPTEQASFWMKNCYVPLSVAYIDPDGVIQEIHHLEPQNTNAVVSAQANIRFALETAQGWFKRHNIQPGMTVRTERGSLMQTFQQMP